jgi:prevent-host-death family protein
MTRNVPALIARTHFGQILDRVSQNSERFIVTKKGQAKAIILGLEDFLQAVEVPPQSLVELQEQARKGNARRLTLEETEEEIAQVRQRKPKQQRAT